MDLVIRWCFKHKTATLAKQVSCPILPQVQKQAHITHILHGTQQQKHIQFNRILLYNAQHAGENINNVQDTANGHYHHVFSNI
jgi:hypothetical protein